MFRFATSLDVLRFLINSENWMKILSFLHLQQLNCCLADAFCLNSVMMFNFQFFFFASYALLLVGVDGRITWVLFVCVCERKVNVQRKEISENGINGQNVSWREARWEENDENESMDWVELMEIQFERRQSSVRSKTMKESLSSLHLCLQTRLQPENQYCESKQFEQSSVLVLNTRSLKIRRVSDLFLCQQLKLNTFVQITIEITQLACTQPADVLLVCEISKWYTAFTLQVELSQFERIWNDDDKLVKARRLAMCQSRNAERRIFVSAIWCLWLMSRGEERF